MLWKGNKVGIFDKYLKYKIESAYIFTKFLLNLLLKFKSVVKMKIKWYRC